MTIFLILGAVAGLYVLALLFRLASYALPVYAGLTCAFLLLRHDVGHLGAILGGLSAGIATLLIGQGLIGFIRSPMIRVGIACLFAIPRGHRRLSGRARAWITGNGQQHAAGDPWFHRCYGDIPLGMAKRDDVGA